MPGVNGAVYPILPRDKDARENENRYGVNCKAIPAKELHGIFSRSAFFRQRISSAGAQPAGTPSA
jgi:hypothetical protein